MSGIAGIVSDNEEGKIGTILKQMLGTIQYSGPNGAGFVIGGIVKHKDKLDELNFRGKKGCIALGQVGLPIKDDAVDVQPVQSEDSKISLSCCGEIYNHQQLRSKLKGEDDFKTDSESEVILGVVKKHYHDDLKTTAKEILPMLDGVYALAVTDNKQIIIARDKIGLRQFYFCMNNNHVAFASEKKPLMAISGDGVKIHRLLPGYMAILDRKGIHDFSYWSPGSLRTKDRIKDKEEALKAYGQVLLASIQKRVAGKKRVGIIFSGGIDSLLISYMVQKLGVPFTCYTAGRQGAWDIKWARIVANQFNFPLKIKILTLEELEKLIPQIINTIEDYSMNQVEAAIALYVSAWMAQEEDERVILTGQGPDEIFGGYPWYSTIVDQDGYESFERYSWEDTLLSYKETFERENKIAMALGLEMSVPYVDPEVIKVAFRISPELKIHRGNDQIQKRVHREYCMSIGIPQEIAFRKKKAAQHGANVHNAFEELSSRTGVTESMLEDAGYDPNQSVIEKLGSSSRYGFRFGDQQLWKPLAQVQYYLDSHAAELNLLPPKSKKLWDKANRKLKTKGAIPRRHVR